MNQAGQPRAWGMGQGDQRGRSPSRAGTFSPRLLAQAPVAITDLQGYKELIFALTMDGRPTFYGVLDCWPECVCAITSGL